MNEISTANSGIPMARPAIAMTYRNLMEVLLNKYPEVPYYMKFLKTVTLSIS